MGQGLIFGVGFWFFIVFLSNVLIILGGLVILRTQELVEIGVGRDPKNTTFNLFLGVSFLFSSTVKENGCSYGIFHLFLGGICLLMMIKRSLMTIVITCIISLYNIALYSIILLVDIIIKTTMAVNLFTQQLLSLMFVISRIKNVVFLFNIILNHMKNECEFMTLNDTFTYDNNKDANQNNTKKDSL